MAIITFKDIFFLKGNCTRRNNIQILKIKVNHVVCIGRIGRSYQGYILEEIVRVKVKIKNLVHQLHAIFLVIPADYTGIQHTITLFLNYRATIQCSYLPSKK